MAEGSVKNRRSVPWPEAIPDKHFRSDPPRILSLRGGARAENYPPSVFKALWPEVTMARLMRFGSVRRSRPKPEEPAFLRLANG
jgi:hypothetical protein